MPPRTGAAPAVPPPSCALPASVGPITKPTAAVIAVLYVVGLTAAEVITTSVDVGWGALCHAVLAAATVGLAGRAVFRETADDPGDNQSRPSPEVQFYVALSLPPFIRLISLAMPIRNFTEPDWYGAIALPMLALAWLAARANGYRPHDAGVALNWSWRGVRTDLAVAFSGFAIGYATYRSQRPEPLIDPLEPGIALVGSLFFIAGVGVTEAVLMRGIVQVATTSLFGPVVGVTYTAALIAALNTGHRTWLDVGLAFGVAVALGAAFHATGSLLGVALASGIARVCLLVIFPVVLGGSDVRLTAHKAPSRDVVVEQSDWSGLSYSARTDVLGRDSIATGSWLRFPPG